MKRYFFLAILIILTSNCTTAIYGQILPLPQLVKKIENSVFTVYATDKNGKEFSQGSGFIIGSNGVCITNFHVLENAQGGYVQNKNGEKFDITKVIDYNADCDLVKFRIDTKGRQFYTLPLSMTKPQKGEELVSLSTPIGFEQTLSNGIVSSIRESELYGTVIQMTTPISHGSSGSPILNRKGEVLGVSTFGVERGQSLNFAVSTLNFSKINKTQNVNVSDITRDPLETPNIKKARSAILEGNYEMALKLVKSEYNINKDNHIACFLFGNIFVEIEEYKLAINALLDAIKLVPEKAEYFNLLGLAHRNNADIEFRANRNANDSFMFALQCYDEAIKLDNYPQAYFNKGNLMLQLFFTYKLLDKSSLYDAINNFNACIQLNPYYETAYVQRAMAKGQLSDYWGAISDCDKAIEINPYFYRSYFTRGDIKGYFLKDREAGIKDLDIALSLVNANEDKADILGQKAYQETFWALDLVNKDFGFAQSLLDDAKKNLQEAYNISGNNVYLDRLNEIPKITPSK
ncbi:MAG: serine protease [Prevotella sp.]|jgi:tetratricopeptide (TPR) repeat protein|nr:serine protease [Prevotella sp.]